MFRAFDGCPMRILCRFVLTVSTLVLLASPSWSQTPTSSVSGRVVDPQGGVVVNAVVSATDATGRSRTMRSADDGRFAFDQVPTGTYTLRAEAPGFVRWIQTIAVAPPNTTVSITLQVSGVREAVDVVGASPAALSQPAATGTRLGLTPLETPASIYILPGDAIRERGDVSLADAKTRAVGVTTQANPGNGGGAVIARGFAGVGSVMQLFDGDQLFVGAGTVTFPFDPWTVDRIEVLGGPASVLYGTGAIGGVVNVVPRKPNAISRENDIRIAAGSFGTWRGAMNSAGPLGANTSYRFDFSGNHSNGWAERGHSNSAALSGSVRRDMTPTLALTISEDYGYQQPDTYFGAPTVNGRIDDALRTVNYNAADAEIRYKDNWTQVKLEYRPSPGVRVRTGVHALATNRHWRNVENYTFEPLSGTIGRDSYIEIFHHEQQYGDRTDAVVNHRLFGRSNTLSAGMDYNFIRFEHVNNSPYDGSSVVDIHNSAPGLFINLAGTFPRYRTRTNQVAWFAEDRFVVSPKVSLVGGVRFDRYAVDRTDLVSNATAQRTYTPVSWRSGVVYAARQGLSVYGQYATATDTIGNVISNSPGRLLLDPTTGRQIEVGVKQSFMGNRGEWTMAGYDIVKNKLLAPVPNNPAVTQQIGQQSSRGIEATAMVALPAGFRFEINGTALRARFDDFAERVGGVLASRVGNTPPNVPELAANAWVTWSALEDWQIRGGLRFVGRRFWNNANDTTAPGYAVVDAGVRRKLTGRTSVDLRVYNLSGAVYATNFYDNDNAPQWILGTPRSAEVSLTVGF